MGWWGRREGTGRPRALTAAGLTPGRRGRCSPPGTGAPRAARRPGAPPPPGGAPTPCPPRTWCPGSGRGRRCWKVSPCGERAKASAPSPHAAAPDPGRRHPPPRPRPSTHSLPHGVAEEDGGPQERGEAKQRGEDGAHVGGQPGSAGRLAVGHQAGLGTKAETRHCRLGPGVGGADRGWGKGAVLLGGALPAPREQRVSGCWPAGCQAGLPRGD